MYTLCNEIWKLFVLICKGLQFIQNQKREMLREILIV